MICQNKTDFYKQIKRQTHKAKHNLVETEGNQIMGTFGIKREVICTIIIKVRSNCCFQKKKRLFINASLPMTPMGRGLALMLILISKPRHGNNVFSNIEFPDNCHCKQVATQNVLIQQLRTNHIVPKYLPDGIFRNN